MKESREEKRGIEIVNMLAAEGTTYSEASVIFEYAKMELAKRKNAETKNKIVAEEKLGTK